MSLSTIDHIVASSVMSLHQPALDVVFALITTAGDVAVTTIVTIALLLWLLLKQPVQHFWLLLITTVGSAVSVEILKTVVARPRPELALLPLESFSFPSGHATIAVALYGTLAYILMQQTTVRWKRHVILSVASLGIVLIGFSRLYFGVHYLTDVLAGYLLGALWFLLARILINRISKASKNARA